jgi:hypothetical protein
LGKRSKRLLERWFVKRSGWWVGLISVGVVERMMRMMMRMMMRRSLDGSGLVFSLLFFGFLVGGHGGCIMSEKIAIWHIRQASLPSMEL